MWLEVLTLFSWMILVILCIKIDRHCFIAFPGIEKRAENMMDSIVRAETNKKQT